MFKRLIILATVLALHSGAAQAIPVTTGDTVRGSYTFTTFGASELEPTSIQLGLSSADLFGGADSVGIRVLDGALNPLLFTRFDASGSGLDPSVGITVSASDFLPDVLGPTDPPKIPQTGFVDITGLGGSFDVSVLTLFATEAGGSIGFLRQAQVSEFKALSPPPTAVPLPATGLLLAGAIAGLFGARARKNLQT